MEGRRAMTTRTTRGLRTTQPMEIDTQTRYIALCGLVLTFVKEQSILSEVGCLPTKGGCCDNDGLLYSRGGVKGTGNIRILDQRDAAQARDARLQVWPGLAHRQSRVFGMEEAETEPVQAASGKLNSSSVARCDSLTIGTREQTAVSPRYLFVILPYGNGNGKRVVGGVWI